MAIIHSVGLRSLGSDTQSTQSLIQYSYFIAAAVILFALVILRIIILRRRNRTLSDFFRIGGSSRYSYGSPPPMESNYGSMYHGIQLTPLPVAYRPDRRIRATDTDAHGRRLDPTMENWDGKDALPAYDNFDRPPKYVEAGWTHGGPPLPAQQSTVTPSPQGDHSGIAHPNIADGATVDPFYHTYAVAGITHETEARSPHDLASS